MFEWTRLYLRYSATADATLPAREWRIAQKVSTAPMIAGSVTAGKSRGMTEGEQMPTATSQK